MDDEEKKAALRKIASARKRVCQLIKEHEQLMKERETWPPELRKEIEDMEEMDMEEHIKKWKKDPDMREAAEWYERTKNEKPRTVQ